jgi:hypothetical protein
LVISCTIWEWLSEGVKQEEERSEAAVIYFEFLLQHSPGGKERGKLSTSVWLLSR